MARRAAQKKWAEDGGGGAVGGVPGARSRLWPRLLRDDTVGEKKFCLVVVVLRRRCCCCCQRCEIAAGITGRCRRTQLKFTLFCQKQ